MQIFKYIQCDWIWWRSYSVHKQFEDWCLTKHERFCFNVKYADRSAVTMQHSVEPAFHGCCMKQWPVCSCQLQLFKYVVQQYHFTFSACTVQCRHLSITVTYVSQEVPHVKEIGRSTALVTTQHKVQWNSTPFLPTCCNLWPVDVWCHCKMFHWWRSTQMADRSSAVSACNMKQLNMICHWVVQWSRYTHEALMTKRSWWKVGLNAWQGKSGKENGSHQGQTQEASRL